MPPQSPSPPSAGAEVSTTPAADAAHSEARTLTEHATDDRSDRAEQERVRMERTARYLQGPTAFTA